MWEGTRIGLSMTEFCGINVSDDLLGLLREIALPLADDDLHGGQEGQRLATIRDIIEGGIGKQRDEELLAALCKHILSSYQNNIWPPPYVFTLDDDDEDNDDDDDANEGDFDDDTIDEEGGTEAVDLVDFTNVNEEYFEENAEKRDATNGGWSSGRGGVEERLNVGDAEKHSEEYLLEEIVRKSEEEERAKQKKQEEEDRLLAERFASIDEASTEKKRLQQEEADADIARQLEAEDFSEAFDNNSAYAGFSANGDTSLKMDYATCKKECRERLCVDGAGTFYSKQFADCVVEATFMHHNDARKAHEQPTYLLDPIYMAHVCTSLLWKTMSSKVEPCKYALKNEVCHINNCTREHYLAHFPCRHWVQATGCHKYLHKDSDGNSLCPFGHNTDIFDEDDIQQAFAEAGVTFQLMAEALEHSDQGFGSDYQQFLGELDKTLDADYNDSRDGGGKAIPLEIDERSFPSKLSVAAAGKLKPTRAGTGSSSDHVTNLKSAFTFTTPGKELTPERAGASGMKKAGSNSMVMQVNDDDIGSATLSQSVRVRDFSKGSGVVGFNGGRDEMAFHARKMQKPRGKKKGALDTAAIGNIRGAADINRERVAALRQPCETAAKRRNEWFNASQAAFRNGHKAQAALLAKNGREEHQRFKAALQKASLEIFYLSNADDEKLNEGVIDLHGLYVEETKIILQSLLCSREGKKVTWMNLNCLNRLKIITGAGRHSEDGVLKLLPAVKNLLSSGELGQTLRYSDIHDREGFPFGVIVDATPLLRVY